MPECKVFYSPLSQRDLDEIYDYIAVELANPVYTIAQAFLKLSIL